MGRYRSSKSHSHHVERISDYFRLHWSWNRYVKGCRQRLIQSGWRDTDEAGARAFCKKWGILFPESD